MDKFKVGMIVQLKSGGPKMTVVEMEGSIHCKWFSGSNLNMDRFIRNP